MGTTNMGKQVEGLKTMLSASGERLEAVFAEMYPASRIAGVGGAKTGLRSNMRPVHDLQNGISWVVSQLPEESSPEIEEAVEKLCEGLLALLPVFEERAEANLRH